MREVRRSPLHDRLEALGARWTEGEGVAVAATVGDSDARRVGAIGLADASHWPRIGFKGPGAPAWVRAQNLILPEPNGWVPLEGGALLARLARTEFFAAGSAATTVEAALRTRPVGVYPVLRQDAGLVLAGERLGELLAETCSVDFRAVRDPEIVLTQMAGVSVLALRDSRGAIPLLRVWCDPTMAPYLWDTLAEIAAELGGGPIGMDVLLAASPRLRDRGSQT